jgi:hypothetical protein
MRARSPTIARDQGTLGSMESTPGEQGFSARARLRSFVYAGPTRRAYQRRTGVDLEQATQCTYEPHARP